MKSSDAAPRILIADDQVDVLEALRLLLKGEGYRTETVNSPAKVQAALEEGEFDVVLMDLNYARDTTSGQEGLDLLARIQGLDSALPVVVMTAWGNVELAVEAMRRTARACSCSSSDMPSLSNAAPRAGLTMPSGRSRPRAPNGPARPRSD